MKLEITGVGPFISTQEIKIDGITVLAGFNGSGKSTFGKALYCLFESFYHIEEKIIYEKKRSIRRIFTNYIHSNRSIMMRKINTYIYSNDSLINDIFDSKDDELTNELVKSFINQIFNDEISDEIKDDLVKRIIDIKNIDDKKIREKILENSIENEFGENFRNIGISDNKSCVELKIKDKKISFSYDYGVSINDFVSIVKNVIYIDDPNVVDYLDSRDSSIFIDNSHRFDLFHMLYSREDIDVSSVDQILINEKIKRIEDKINVICDGDISSTDSKTFKYLSNDFKEGLGIGNMATGLKTFAIIKMLLKKGYFEENGIVIFDEPEIHLHPKWQKAWAEIIVLLHKEFNANILLSTHSSDFLSFLELYVHKYNAINNTKLYILEKTNVYSSSVKDVSENWDIIYNQLGNPFISAIKELENIND